MKKILLLALLAFGMNVKAQITLEHTYDSASTIFGGNPSNDSQLMIINFAISGERYVKLNRWGKVMNIYDMNHSLIKTISLSSLPLNSGGVLGDILYISQNLFSTDSKIAFMYGYDTPSDFTGIYNEDGNLLFSDTGLAAIRPNFEQQQFPIYNTSTGTKMILSYEGSNLNSFKAKVFSLPGTLTTAIQEANNNLIAMQNKNYLSNPYPNPSTNTTKIDYTLPDSVNEGVIVFYNLQGIEMKRFKVDKTFSTLLVSTADIAAGTYLYQLQTSVQSTEGKKMVVIK